MKTSRALWMLVLFANAFADIQAADTPVSGVVLPHTEQRQFASPSLNWTYQLSVNLPEDYANSDKTYPVLYVLDGAWNFTLIAGIQDGLFYGKRLPALIVVALDYGVPYGELMKRRAHDFTPTASDKVPGSGGAPEFLAFLEKELIPYIDQTYRTDPKDRALLGHSYSGLFGVYAWLERPQLFQRIVAASPSLWWDDELLLKRASERLATQSLPGRLDLSLGGEEENGDMVSVKRMAALLEKTPPKSGAWRFTLYPGENHTSVKPISLTLGLTWVYQP